jgi:hypothetical protein
LNVYPACSGCVCRDVPQYKVMKYLVFWIILSSLLSELQVARERTHTCPRAYAYIRTLAARSSRQGGLSLETLSSEERLRCAPFLTVLGTHCISRSFHLPPQCMLASLAAVPVVAGPASHAHKVVSKRPRNQTPHAYAHLCQDPLSGLSHSHWACPRNLTKLNPEA